MGMIDEKPAEPDFDKNYIVVQGWMIRLGLTPSELLLFALIRGFCSYKGATFKGSLTYIQTWLGCARPTAVRLLNSLESKGLIARKKGDGKHTSEYSLKWDTIAKYTQRTEEGGSLKMRLGSFKMKLGSSKIELGSFKMKPDKYKNTDTNNDLLLEARTREGVPIVEEEDRRRQHDKALARVLAYDWVND